MAPTWLVVSVRLVAAASALIAATLVAAFLTSSQAQVIRLRHPEAGNHHLLFNPSLLSSANRANEQQVRPPARPASGVFTNDRPANRFLLASQEAARRRTPRAGSVVVRFDRNHEIERLQYVLQDGQLATIYSRRSEIAGEPIGKQVLGVDKQSDEPKQVQQQVEAVKQQQQQQQEQIFQPDEQQQLTFETHELDDEPAVQSNVQAGELDSKTSDILASLVRDTIEAQVANSDGGQSAGPKLPSKFQLKKFGAILGKLKMKIAAKLKKLPHLVQKKLKAKSSNGKLFVDNASGEQVPIELEDEQHQELVNNPVSQMRFEGLQNTLSAKLTQQQATVATSEQELRNEWK